MRASVVLVAFLLSSFLASSSGSGATPAGLARFLLVYATCDSDPCNGASTEHLAQSRDGVRWTPVPSFALAAAGNPSAARRAGRLYVLDSLRASPEGLTAGIRRFNITAAGLSETKPADVTVTLASPGDAQTASEITGSLALDPTGGLVLVYALRLEPGAIGCPAASGKACLKLRTATEVPSSDGADFTGDPGNRRVVSFDPANSPGSPIAYAGEGKGYVVLLAGPGQCLRVFTATDLHVTYHQARGLPGGCLTGPRGSGEPERRVSRRAPRELDLRRSRRDDPPRGRNETRSAGGADPLPGRRRLWRPPRAERPPRPERALSFTLLR